MTDRIPFPASPVWLAAAKPNEHSRYGLHAVRIDGARAVATNGRMLAVVPHAEPTDAPAVLIDATAASRAARVVGADVEIHVDGATAAIVGKKATVDVDVVDAAFPADLIDSIEPKTEPTATVRVNARYLVALLKAIGVELTGSSERDTAHQVTIELRSRPVDPIVLRTDAGAVGYVMPIAKS